MSSYHVHAEWDEEASVWVAASDEVPGLATGADTLDSLIEKLRIVVPELLEENGLLGEDVADVQITITAERTAHAKRAA